MFSNNKYKVFILFSAVWAFINNMKADCIFTTRFAVHCPETVRQLLRKKPDSR